MGDYPKGGSLIIWASVHCNTNREQMDSVSAAGSWAKRTRICQFCSQDHLARLICSPGRSQSTVVSWPAISRSPSPGNQLWVAATSRMLTTAGGETSLIHLISVVRHQKRWYCHCRHGFYPRRQAASTEVRISPLPNSDEEARMKP